MALVTHTEGLDECGKGGKPDEERIIPEEPHRDCTNLSGGCQGGGVGVRFTEMEGGGHHCRRSRKPTAAEAMTACWWGLRFQRGTREALDT